jgi:hypothetical protein
VDCPSKIVGPSPQHTLLGASFQQTSMNFEGRRRYARLVAVVAWGCVIAFPYVDFVRCVFFENVPDIRDHFLRRVSDNFPQRKSPGSAKNRFKIEIGRQTVLLGQFEGEKPWAGKRKTKLRPSASDFHFNGRLGSDLTRNKNKLGHEKFLLFAICEM